MEYCCLFNSSQHFRRWERLSIQLQVTVGYYSRTVLHRCEFRAALQMLQSGWRRFQILQWRPACGRLKFFRHDYSFLTVAAFSWISFKVHLGHASCRAIVVQIKLHATADTNIKTHHFTWRRFETAVHPLQWSPIWFRNVMRSDFGFYLEMKCKRLWLNFTVDVLFHCHNYGKSEFLLKANCHNTTPPKYYITFVSMAISPKWGYPQWNDLQPSEVCKPISITLDPLAWRYWSLLLSTLSASQT